MLKFSYEEIIRRIEEKTGLPQVEIEEKINQKISQLSDLVSKEGAAHIVANQFGIKLFENLNERKVKISEVAKGASFVNVLGRVTTIYGVNKFNRKGTEARVASLMLADESGSIRVAIWDEKFIRLIDDEKLNEGDIIKITNGYSRENNNKSELHIGSNTTLEVNPEGEKVGEISLAVSETNYSIEKKKIDELEEGVSAELFGTAVQVFEPRFYDACSKCGRKPKASQDKFLCKEHGEVEIRKSPILNFFLDDGFGNIRVVCFNEQVEQTLSKKDITPEGIGAIEDIKSLVLGNQYIIKGRAVKNQFFGSLEFIAREVKEANPVELIEEVK